MSVDHDCKPFDSRLCILDTHVGFMLLQTCCKIYVYESVTFWETFGVGKGGLRGGAMQ